MNELEWLLSLKLLEGQKLLKVSQTSTSKGEGIIIMHFPSMVLSIMNKNAEALSVSPAVPVERIDELDTEG